MISIGNYYHKLLSDLVQCLNVLIENYDEAAIHSLRLVYKRIRAIHKFISGKLNGTVLDDEQIYNLDVICKKAGIIREYQVNRKLIHKNIRQLGKSFDAFTKYLDDELATANSMMSDLIKETDIDKIIKSLQEIVKYIKGIDEKKLKRKFIRFIKTKIRKTETLIFKRSDNDRYHSIRIQIKEIFYFLKMAYKKKDLRDSNFSLDRLKNIEVKLGKWHDNELLLKQLNDFFKKKHITNLTRYNFLIKSINSRQNILIKKLDHEIVTTVLEMSCFK